MLTDTEIRIKGLRALVNSLGDVNAEKFISLISKDPFDYTEWQSTLWNTQTVETLSENAVNYRKNAEQHIHSAEDAKDLEKETGKEE